MNELADAIPGEHHRRMPRRAICGKRLAQLRRGRPSLPGKVHRHCQLPHRLFPPTAQRELRVES